MLGKLAAALAPPEPQLQHAALRLTARGWETAPLPGARRLGRARSSRSICTPTRRSPSTATGARGASRSRPIAPVGEVTRELLAAVRRLAGAVELNLTPQETPWTTPLDRTRSTPPSTRRGSTPTSRPRPAPRWCSAALRAPYRGRSTPVNAWWGSFDLAVSLFSGKSAEPPGGGLHHAQRGQCGADRGRLVAGRCALSRRAAFYAYAHPAPAGFENATLQPAAAHWDATLGEFILDWDDIRDEPGSARERVAFARSAVLHACTVCGWDPALAASAEGIPPPVV